jgi:hypothetical protein
VRERLGEWDPCSFQIVIGDICLGQNSRGVKLTFRRCDGEIIPTRETHFVLSIQKDRPLRDTSINSTVGLQIPKFRWSIPIINIWEYLKWNSIYRICKNIIINRLTDRNIPSFYNKDFLNFYGTLPSDPLNSIRLFWMYSIKYHDQHPSPLSQKYTSLLSSFSIFEVPWIRTD